MAREAAEVGTSAKVDMSKSTKYFDWVPVIKEEEKQLKEYN